MKRVVIILIVSFFFLSISGSVRADILTPQMFDDEEVDAFIVSQMHRHNLPGVAVAITRGDDVIYMKGFGSALRGQPMTVDTPMFIGSLTKSFTALSIMQLYESGQVDIDQPVQKYLPEFEIADEEASRTITIRNLLNHASGLSDFSYLPTHENDVSISENIKYLNHAELSAPIGTTFQYFNTNYAVLGALIEKVTGMDYEAYIDEYIFSKLGMENSYTDKALAESAGLPPGYGNMFGFSFQREQPFRKYDLPAGYLMMSVRDLSKYLRMQVNGGTLNGISLIDDRLVTEMHTPQVGLDVPYGMGWFIYDDCGTQIIKHGGTNENFHTSGMILPDKDMTIAILVNTNSIYHAMFAHSYLDDGIRRIATGIPVQTPVISARLFGAILLLGFIVSTFFNIRSLIRMNQWMQIFQNKSFAGKIWNVGMHFMRPLVLVFIGPLLVENILRRGFSWEAGWAQAPDVVLWLWSVVLFDLIRGLIKVVKILRSSRNNNR